MNWYKLAEAALNITPDQFQAMVDEGKKALARNTSLSPQTQLLFFTQEYEGKSNILWALAENTSITPQTQSLFFTQEYEGKSGVLSGLAENWRQRILWALAENTSITNQTQSLFFTQEYKGKSNILYNLAHNRSFLKGFTLQDMREFAKIKQAKLLAYRARLKTIKEKIKL